MDTEKVSITMPVYNSWKTLCGSTMSVLNQSVDDIELITVDDGSIDYSNEILSETALCDYRVIACSKENRGVSNSRNVGIELSANPYIAFVDADDLLDPQFVEICAESMNREKIDLCVGGVKTVWVNKSGETEKTNEWSKSTVLPYNEIIHKSEIEELILKPLVGFKEKYDGIITFASSCNKIFRKTIISKNFLAFNENRDHAEDWQFMIEYLAKSQSIYMVDKPTYDYVRYPDTETLSQRPQKNQFELSIWWHTYIRKLFPNWGWDEIKDIEQYTSTPMYSLDYYLKMCFFNQDRTQYRMHQRKIFEWCIEHKGELMREHSKFPIILYIPVITKSFLLFAFFSDTYCIVKRYGWKKIIYDHIHLFIK